MPFRSFRALAEGPIVLRPTSAVAEGDRVAVEVEGGAALQGGGGYDNQYHFVFVFRGDRISAIREYMNPANAKAGGRPRGARGSYEAGSAIARNRSSIASIWSGTSSWTKWPEPTVCPERISGSSARRRAMSERGAGSLPAM